MCVGVQCRESEPCLHSLDMNRDARSPKKRKPDDGQRNLDSDDPQRRSKRPKQDGPGRGISNVEARL